MTSDDSRFDADYARLIHVGINSSLDARHEYGSIPEEQAAHWRSEVAEPWWQAMRERAERDGLRVECFMGGDSLMRSVGVESLIAAARLLTPSGEHYEVSAWQLTDAGHAAVILDWGEKLATARTRHPYEFALGERSPKEPRRRAWRRVLGRG